MLEWLFVVYSFFMELYKRFRQILFNVILGDFVVMVILFSVIEKWIVFGYIVCFKVEVGCVFFLDIF